MARRSTEPSSRARALMARPRVEEERLDPPPAAEGIGGLRAQIEEAAPASPQLVRQRGEVDRFLFGHELRRDRWEPTKPWIAFRRRLRKPSPDRLAFEDLVREFFALIHTAPHWMASDAQESERRLRAAKAMGSRRQLAKLDALGPEATRVLATLGGEREQLDFLTTTVAGFPFCPFEDGREHRVIVNAGDLVPNPENRGRTKLRPGSGRRGAAETARDELMRFLKSLGLSVRSADTIVRDVFSWYLGYAIERNTARMRDQRARRKRI